MFLHLFKYRLKILLKNKNIIFWSLFFPIILAIFFKLSFHNLDALDNFETIPVGLVSTPNAAQDHQFFKQGLTTASNHKKKIFSVIDSSEKEAKKALAEGEISGYFMLDQKEPTLYVQANGFDQTFLNNFLQQFLYQKSTTEQLLSENPRLMMSDIIDDLMVNENYTKNLNDSYNRPKPTSIYFFTVIALACMFGMEWGMKNSEDIEPDQTSVGIRIGVGPPSKLGYILSNLLSSFCIFFVEILILLAFMRFILNIDFGNRWKEIILTCMVACILSLSIGSLIGNTVKGNYQLKSAIMMIFSIFGSFLSGMIFINIKYWIAIHMPFLALINPANLITDSLYQLYYYSDLSSFYHNILIMVGMIVCINLINFGLLRRETYVSI